MNRSKIVILIALVAAVVFLGASFFLQQSQQQLAEQNAQNNQVAADFEALERPYSPSFGPDNAKVTIVEFFDPACEACRAFYPFVKKIMAEHPDDIRLVLRYTTFHQGSDEVVGILEAARKQKLFKPVLEAVLLKQPEWAMHGQPDISKAWAAAESAGLNLEQARKDAGAVTVSSVLKQEAADVKTMKVEKTPTFFVNGKPLPSFGAEQLYNLVTSEINR